MKRWSNRFRGCVWALLFAATLLPIAASAQITIVYPTWMVDSGVTGLSPGGPLFSRYLVLWQYFRGNDTTRFNLWTFIGDPLNPNDDYFEIGFFDTNQTTFTLECPWGSRLFSSERPTDCVVGANGRTSGDDRPIANDLSLLVEDSASMTGFTILRYPEGGTATLAPPVATTFLGQGYYAPYVMPTNAPTAAGVDLLVTQKTQFARDLLRYEVIVQNRGGSARRVGARLLLDCYVDEWGPTRSVFIPKTRERIFFEKEFTGAAVPEEWEMYDDDEGPSPIFIAKGLLVGNGATRPSKVIFGNTLQMIPYVAATANAWDYTPDPNFELRLSDIGCLVYWDPVSIPGGQSRSFVTYVGVGAASHGMSDFYQVTPSGQLNSQGFIGALQTPYAMPLVNGDADLTNATFTAYLQNQNLIGAPGGFAFLELPDGLKFSDSAPTQSPRVDLGHVAALGDALDEKSGSWTIQATGIESGLLPVNVTVGNAFGDSSRVRRMVNVPQGRLYQLGEDWRFLTFPFTYSNLQDDPATVLGLAPGTFQIVRYNGEIREYENVTHIQPGQGYWVRLLAQGPQFVRLNNATPIKLGQRDIFTTTMKNGWNQMGNPSPYVVPVRELRFITQFGGIVSYDQAVGGGFIRSGFFAYNRKTGRYETLNRESLIQPGQAVWIYSNGERTVLWPSPQGPQLSITP